MRSDVLGPFGGSTEIGKERRIVRIIPVTEEVTGGGTGKMSAQEGTEGEVPRAA